MNTPHGLHHSGGHTNKFKHLGDLTITNPTPLQVLTCKLTHGPSLELPNIFVCSTSDGPWAMCTSFKLSVRKCLFQKTNCQVVLWAILRGHLGICWVADVCGKPHTRKCITQPTFYHLHKAFNYHILLFVQLHINLYYRLSYTGCIYLLTTYYRIYLGGGVFLYLFYCVVGGAFRFLSLFFFSV